MYMFSQAYSLFWRSVSLPAYVLIVRKVIFMCISYFPAFSIWGPDFDAGIKLKNDVHSEAFPSSTYLHNPSAICTLVPKNSTVWSYIKRNYCCHKFSEWVISLRFTTNNYMELQVKERCHFNFPLVHHKV